MRKKVFIDLIRPFSAGIPRQLYFGKPLINNAHTMAKGGVLASKIICTMHTGTHCDAPRHAMEYEFDGRWAKYIHETPVNVYAGDVVCLSVDTEPWELITGRHLDDAYEKVGMRLGELEDMVVCLNMGIHRLFDDSKAYYHYSIDTGVEMGKWFVKYGVRCVTMDSQALDYPLHTTIGNNGMTRMSFLGASGKPLSEECRELLGKEAHAEFDKNEYIGIHEQKTYDGRFSELEALDCWGTWESCHKELLEHGIVGVGDLGGGLDKINGKRSRLYCFPLRWYMGDDPMARCVVEIDGEDLTGAPNRTYKYGGIDYQDSEGNGDSDLAYIQRLFGRNK